jgi:hypothetical protein
VNLLFPELQNTTTELPNTHPNSTISFDALLGLIRIYKESFDGGVIIS